MTRRLPEYSEEKLAEVCRAQRLSYPDTHVELLADYAAIVLTNAAADDLAERDAARQAMAWMQRNPVEAR